MNFLIGQQKGLHSSSKNLILCRYSSGDVSSIFLILESKTKVANNVFFRE